MKLSTRTITIVAWVSPGMNMANSGFAVETAAVEVAR